MSWNLLGVWFGIWNFLNPRYINNTCDLTSASPEETIRIAAGVGTKKKADISVYLRGPACSRSANLWMNSSMRTFSATSITSSGSRFTYDAARARWRNWRLAARLRRNRRSAAGPARRRLQYVLRFECAPIYTHPDPPDRRPASCPAAASLHDEGSRRSISGFRRRITTLVGKILRRTRWKCFESRRGRWRGFRFRRGAPGN